MGSGRVKKLVDNKEWLVVEVGGELRVLRKGLDLGMLGVRVVLTDQVLVVCPDGGLMEPWSFGDRPAFRVGRTCEATICSSRWKRDGTKKRTSKKK